MGHADEEIPSSAPDASCGCSRITCA
jgi:hypothetical protein